MQPWGKQIYVLLRIVLGALFLWASIGKINDPGAFAKVIENYHILPAGLINLTALVLPWLEAVCGLLLIAGFFVDGAALIINLLMVIFMAALFSSYMRGIDISCGCFSTSLQSSGRSLFYWYLFRDLVILAMGSWIFYYRYRREFPIL